MTVASGNGEFEYRCCLELKPWITDERCSKVAHQTDLLLGAYWIMSKKINTLIVLGAGASIGSRRYPIEGSVQEAFPMMPSSRNFFYGLFKGKAKLGESRRFLNMLGVMYEGTNWLINQAWGMDKPESGFDPEQWRGINVEEVLSFVDIGSRMYSRGATYQKGFSIARSSLIQFIVMMLMTRTDGQHCELLMELFLSLRPRDSIISFNYDTLADHTLQRVKKSHFRAYANLMSGKFPRVRDYASRGILLKLHGSVNWRVCTNRQCRYYKRPYIPFTTKKRVLPRIFGGGFGDCLGCGEKRHETAIIPPMTEKSLDRHDFFHRLWLIARAQLPRFDRIVFVGYSFPSNDAYSDWLFRQLRFIDQKRPQIIVVNPEALKSRNPVRQRYVSLFRGFDIDFYGTLASFVEGPWRSI